MKINEDCNKLGIGSSDGNIIFVDIQRSDSGSNSSNISDSDNSNSNDTKTNLVISLIKHAMHDLPITGMSFVPMEARKYIHLKTGSDNNKKGKTDMTERNFNEILLTCSADNKFIVTTINKNTMYQTYMYGLLSLFICLLSILCYFMINDYPLLPPF